MESRVEKPAGRPGKEAGLFGRLKKRFGGLGMAIGFIVLFLVGASGGYFYFMKDKAPTVSKGPEKAMKKEVDYSSVKVYYPYNRHLNVEERKVTGASSSVTLAEAVVREFLKGPENSLESYVPVSVELLGIYPGSDGILYIDLSNEFRSNFRGDVLTEFLLLRGLYESIVSNVYGIKGVKVIIEGEEVESIGGHLSIKYPLSEVVASTLLEDVNEE